MQFTVRLTRGLVRVQWAWMAGALALATVAAAAAEQPPAAPREALSDAWWTGPLLAPNASTFPRGHALVETYVYDVIGTGRFDAAGHRHASAAEHDLGSLTYLIYGVTDRVSVGLLPRFAFNEPAGAANSSSPGIGDFGAQVQYGLTGFREGSWVPATAVVVGETFPTGRYDRLQRASDGMGAGVYTTSLSWYSQDYLWLPNGRILRVRFDLTYAVSASAGVRDASVYGTGRGFDGRVYPGHSFNADAAAEYSLTRNWVLATDLVYQHNDSTRIAGTVTPPPPGAASLLDLQSGASEYFAIAPAVEFNWSPRAGVIFGTRIIGLGRNTAASITPAAAINLVF